MKKILLSALCITAFTLTACDKKTDNTSAKTNDASSPTVVAPATLSQNNQVHMQSDLRLIQTLTNNKSQDALKFQTEVNEAAQRGEEPDLKLISVKLETYVNDFNKELDALKLQSSEVDSLRTKLKESNQIGLDLTKAGTSAPQDTAKIAELQKKATDLQQELISETQAIEIKANNKT